VPLRQPVRETAPDAHQPGLYSTYVGKKYAMERIAARRGARARAAQRRRGGGGI
jgi:hypothetical protein